MIDLHCHILPGVDDGSKDMEESLAMARAAIQQGITHILCTPHHNNGKYSNPADKVISIAGTLQKELDARGVELTLLEGQEVRLTGSLMEDIKKGEILFTDLSNRYILIEFPTSEIPKFAEKVFFQLLSNGHIPVIVHPERNSGFLEAPNRLIPFIQMGALTQLTAPSLVGKFGKSVQKVSVQMLDHGLIHMLASDAHGLERRRFYLKEAFAEIRKLYGRGRVKAMEQTAKDLLNGDDVSIPAYSEIPKKKFKLF